jgi:hypothetical protein
MSVSVNPQLLGQQGVTYESYYPTPSVPVPPNFNISAQAQAQALQGMQGLVQGTVPNITQIASLQDLLTSREATLVKENTDKGTLNVLLTPTSETFKLSLLQWASTGFQSGYTIFTLQLIAPKVCSDGKTRDIGGYILFLTNKSSEDITVALQSQMPGIKVFHSFLNSSIRIHVSKLQ